MAGTTVTTPYGTIQGISKGGCSVFRGVPYAKPPVGALRFHRPVPLDKPAWTGTWDASFFRNKSAQMDRREGFYYKEFYSDPAWQTKASEDCLYLNIWTPEGDCTGLPVAVYVHGGAFMGGAGSNLPFDGEAYAKRGVILVTINYRLGMLGFLAHPLLAKASGEGTSGNYGLWDQLAAIDWVRENIACFGGDPERITLFGQSAGAMSLQVLACTGRLTGNVCGMILQSGGGYGNPLTGWKKAEEGEWLAEEAFASLGITPENIRTRLAEASEEEIDAAAGRAIGRSFKEGKGLPFMPVIDGELITGTVEELTDAGKALQVPYILGSNEDDITTEEETNRCPETNRMHRANVEMAKRMNEQGNPAYVYYFKRKLPGDDAGAFHSAELWYTFDTLQYSWRPFEEHDRVLAGEIMDRWCAFMKTGKPVPKGAEDWKPCTGDEASVMVFA